RCTGPAPLPRQLQRLALLHRRADRVRPHRARASARRSSPGIDSRCCDQRVRLRATGKRRMTVDAVTVPALRSEQIEAAMSPIYQRGARFIGRFLLAHMVVALALAPFYGTWLITLTVGPAAVLMFHVSRILLPRSFFTRCVAGTALQTF